MADEIAKSTNAPPAETIEAELIAAEALLAAGRVDEAERRLTQVEPRLDPRTTPGAWGEFLRLRGDLRARQTRTTEASRKAGNTSTLRAAICCITGVVVAVSNPTSSCESPSITEPSAVCRTTWVA